jgi:hypothetical protein
MLTRSGGSDLCGYAGLLICVELSNFGQLRVRRTDGGVSNEAYFAVDAHPSGEPSLFLFVLQMLIDQLSSFAAGKIGIRLGQ